MVRSPQPAGSADLFFCCEAGGYTGNERLHKSATARAFGAAEILLRYRRQPFGDLIATFQPGECSNYFVNAGYASVKQ
jgi:hypothetical protein